MKFIDLKPLSIKRLKAYRRTLEARVACYEVCNCGSSGCDFEKECNKDNPNYINLRACLDRVNKELARKQLAERKVNPAHVPTVNETRDGKPRKQYGIQKKKRKAPVEDATGRTVLFHFEQKGFNAHTADGSFTYDTPALAQAQAARMNLNDKFTNVRIV